MKITQLRNATAIIDVGDHRILVDPMLAPKRALPPLRMFGRRERNPIVELPENSATLLAAVTDCLITHCQKGHFDHLDRAGKRWLRSHAIAVHCTPHDAAYLRQRGLNVVPLAADHQEPHPFLNGQIRTVPCVHGTGAVGLFMEHGVGYFMQFPGEPSLYVSGDTILTPAVRRFVEQHRPDVALVPAGGARFDLGHEIIMGVHDVIAFARACSGITLANHLEALSHCPVQRTALAAAAASAGLHGRLLVPADGETLEFTA
ncbi:MAG TPA: MBL fold metallo-hydrolase [Noviherbaspirillum sp.]|jgi:L-ascorbate metabolism protein UlaG (beta-lactamase superfamily)|uniref:MBL fold metallo-hydrolase n=1 Tax=Noviherbaspirillum sp. TaxID=1926288 RepID=UPI002F930D59